MMAEQTNRLALPLLVAGQAQKEMTHNEALTLIDALVQPVVQDHDSAAPPATPQPGAAFIIATGATGDWTGRDGQVALFTAGGWRYVVPAEGMAFWSASAGVIVRRAATQWRVGQIAALEVIIAGNKVLGSRQPPIVGPSGGTNADGEARTAINAIIGALQAHGLIAA